MNHLSAAGTDDLATGLFAECTAIATKGGFSLRPEFAECNRTMLTAPAAQLTASMLRDIERGARVEADHILGDPFLRPVVLLTALSRGPEQLLCPIKVNLCQR